MTVALIDLLLDAALVQFGSFRPNDSAETPVALHIEMLTSYPVIMRVAADLVAQTLESMSHVDRLMCSVEAVGLGTTVAMNLGKPLVYQHEGILIGAYDIGHPTALIVNDTGNRAAARALINSARQVGLNVTGIAALIKVGKAKSVDDVPCWSVLSLDEIVSRAESERRIPPGQSERVRRWLEQV